MPGPSGASRVPDGLSPVPVPARGPSGLVMAGLVVFALAVVVATCGGAGTQGWTFAPLPPATATSPAGAPVTTSRSAATPERTVGTLTRRVPDPVRSVAACPPGSNPDQPGPIDRARSATDGGGIQGAASSPITYDSAAGKIVALSTSSQATWTFDVCTNTWTLMRWGAGPDAVVALAYDPAADLIFAVEAGDAATARLPHIWYYDLKTNAWTRKGLAPGDVARLWYDAASGGVTAWTTRADDGSADWTGQGTVWSYDVALDRWTTVGVLEVVGGFPWGNPGNELLAYDASVDRVVATVTMGEAGIRTRLFDMRTGGVADARAIAPWAGQCGFMVQMYCYGGVAGSAIAYDERTQRVVVLIGGRVFAYDAVEDRWDTLFEPEDWDASGTQQSGGSAFGAMAREGRSMVYDPLNRRLVVLVGGPFGAVDRVLAFDATTREWTVLLEPSGASPTQ